MGRLVILLVTVAACLDQPRITVDKPVVELPRGAGTDVAVSVDGQPFPLDEVVWLVDDPTIASIQRTSDGTRLRIDSVAEGQTTIHIGSHGQVVDVTTHVTPPAFVQLWIEPANVATTIGTGVPIHATAIDTTSTIVDVSNLTSWQVMDPAIATLDRGMVQGSTPGHTMLQAVLAGTQTSVPITVY